MSTQYADIAETVWYSEDSTAPLTIVKPPSFGPNQLLVLAEVMDDTVGTSANLTGPAGWALKDTVDITGAVGKVWVHVYDGTEPSTWDFGYSSGNGIAACLLRVVDADLTPTVVVAHGSSTSNSSSEDSPTVSATSGNDLLVCTMSNTGAAAAFLATEPSGMYNLGKTQTTTFQAQTAARQYLTSAGATGVRTWTGITPTGRQAGMFSIAIKSSGLFDPDPPPNPPPPIVPPYLLRELVAWKQQQLVGGNLAPIVKEKLSGGASGANVTLNTAATTDTTDFLVLFHSNNFNVAANMVAPTGTAGTWIQQALGDLGTNAFHIKIWTRPVTVGGVQQVIVAPTIDGEEITAHLFVVSGTDPANPIDGTPAGSSGSASTAQPAPSVVTLTPATLLLCGVASQESDYTAPSGMLKETEVDVVGFHTGSTASQNLGVDGATGTRTFTCSATATFVAASIALKSAPTVVVVAATATPAPLVVTAPGKAFPGTAPIVARSTLQDDAVVTTSLPIIKAAPLVFPVTLQPTIMRSSFVDVVASTSTQAPVVVASPTRLIPGIGPIVQRGTLQDDAVLTTGLPIVVAEPLAFPVTPQATVLRSSLTDAVVATVAVPGPIVVAAPARVIPGTGPAIQRGSLQDDAVLTTRPPLVVTAPLVFPVTPQATALRSSLTDVVFASVGIPSPIVVATPARVIPGTGPTVSRNTLQDDAVLVTASPIVVSAPRVVTTVQPAIGRSSLADVVVVTGNTVQPIVVAAPARVIPGSGPTVSRNSLQDDAVLTTAAPIVVTQSARMMVPPVIPTFTPFVGRSSFADALPGTAPIVVTNTGLRARIKLPHLGRSSLIDVVIPPSFVTPGPIVVSRSERPATRMTPFIARNTHSCVDLRPNSGTTVRILSTTTRPDTGTTEDPC